MKSVYITSLAIFLFAAAAAAQRSITAQLGQPFGNTTSCNFGTLFGRMDRLQDACDGETCDVTCAGKLLPLLDDCRGVLMPLYDGTDGHEDGQATVLNDAYASCLSIPGVDLIDELKTMHENGDCPNFILDGLAETPLQLPVCADAAAWDGGRCAMSIASGVFSCARDFCITVPTRDAPCMMAGQCDQSCGFCSNNDLDGGHRRRRLLAAYAMLLDHATRRGLQMSHVTCDPATFAEHAHAVDDACCDTDTGANQCEGGTPATCDAKCAVIFNTFYDQCQRILAASMGLAEMAGYDRLYATCTQALPTEPLLRAAIACGADPCEGRECGEHGSCDAGSCRCELGHSGSACETADPCEVPAHISCGGHGNCNSGSCACDHGYTGTHCETAPLPCCTGAPHRKPHEPRQ